MAKVFLFDEAGEFIRCFPTHADCGAAIGVGPMAIRDGVKRQQVISGRYYVAATPKLPPPPRKGFERNLALNKRGSSPASVGVDIGARRVSFEELLGFELLSSGLCFDSYLFGSTPIRPERAESIPEHLSKYWNE